MRLGGNMSRTVAIGIQDFGDLIRKNYFYIDKTAFIKEWWESGDSVTLITRPRRFGKTLNMSMVEHFFSVQYAGQGNLFEGLAVWKEKNYREIQGTYPVISLSFANVKENNYRTAGRKYVSYWQICIPRMLFCWTAAYCMKKISIILNVLQKIWTMRMQHRRCISYQAFYTGIMGKK